MNSAINNTLQQYLDTFMDTIAERFDINRDELHDLWKETQKKKFTKKNKKKNSKRKKSSVPSAYILFSNDERPKIKNDNPDIKFNDVGKELGRRWREASANVKAHYKKKHDDLVEEMTANMSRDEEDETTSTTNETVMEEEEPVIADVPSDDEIVATTTTEEEKPKKTKKPKKSKEIEIPDDIEDERERELWLEFAKMTITELRTQCDHNNLKKSKNRNVMIHALVIHRIALEDGSTNLDSDEEDED